MRVLFLVKNYIGFGHIRRTLLIAKEMKRQKPGTEIIFISQAKSLKLFLNMNFQVINFPFIDLLPTGALIAGYQELLREIIDSLEPDLVIEDTYPDNNYLQIPSVNNSPKILILRRIDPISFNEYRKNGCFNQYNRILVVQEYEEFKRENHIPESNLYVKLSNKFIFFGPVYHKISKTELVKVKKKYNIKEDTQLIIINAGAGGDHINDAYCDLLYRNVNTIAFNTNKDIKFIIVTGPYYNSHIEKLSSNVKLVQFEPNLPALLYLANIVIIRPGYNVTYEALSGNANIILVPGNSYMEIQNTYAKYLVDHFGVNMVSSPNFDELYQLIYTLINKSPDNKERQKIIPHQKLIATKIIEESSKFQSKFNSIITEIKGVRLLFVICLQEFDSPINKIDINEFPKFYFISNTVLRNDQTLIPTVGQVINDRSENNYHVAFFQSDNIFSISPEDLRKHNIETILYINEDEFEISSKDWCNAHQLESNGIFSIELDQFSLSKSWKKYLGYKIIKNKSTYIPQALHIQIKASNYNEYYSLLKELYEWIFENKIHLLSLEEYIEIMVLNRLGRE